MNVGPYAVMVSTCEVLNHTLADSVPGGVRYPGSRGRRCDYHLTR